LELIKRFDFVRVESKSTTVELTEKQKNILDERLENYKNNPNSYINLEEAKENLRMKYEL
jgi:putative addiction module component (TIGR02574 family)